MKKVILRGLKLTGLGLTVLVAGCAAWVGSVMYNLDDPFPSISRVPDTTTARTISDGPIVGITPQENLHAWIGIPYAGPVSGEHRWTMPTNPEAWTEERAFTQQAPFCPQFSFDQNAIPEKGYIGEEDCLTLDLYAPAFDADKVPTGEKKLPVMVWIHGGGNTLGTAGDLTHASLVSEGNIILVAIQYRVGPLGFFSHRAIRDAGIPTANFGLEDQIKALKWVQDNVAAFGGNPNNVTLFGESAGGVNIFTHILSERATGLFHKTIIQSGSSNTLPRHLAEHSLKDKNPGSFNNSSDIISKWLVGAGMASDINDADKKAVTMSSDELLAVMKKIPTHDLLKVYPRNKNDAMYQLPATIRDGFTIPNEDPKVLILEQGKFNSTPGIYGNNRDEMGWGFLFNKDITPRNFIGVPTVKNFDNRDAVIRYSSQIWKYIGADRPASWLHQTGEKNIFVYRFDWDEEPTYLGRDMGKYVGAAHAFDIPFVFGYFHDTPLPKYFLTKENSEGRHALSKSMREYWTAFAHTGNPGTGLRNEQPLWQAWQPDTMLDTMLLDTPEGGGPQMAEARVDSENIQNSFDADPVLNAFGKCAVANFLVAAAEWKREQLQTYKDGVCVVK